MNDETCPKCRAARRYRTDGITTYDCQSKDNPGGFAQSAHCFYDAAAYERGKRDAGADSLLAILARQMAWSMTTFGPRPHVKEITAHIRKELKEIEAEPEDLEEWIDVVILALDGAWRTGATREEIVAALAAKQAKNEKREWPDWRTHPEGVPFEHVRQDEEEKKDA